MIRWDPGEEFVDAGDDYRVIFASMIVVGALVVTMSVLAWVLL